MEDYDYYGMMVEISNNNQFINSHLDRDLYHKWGRWWLTEIDFSLSLCEQLNLESDVKVAVIDSGLNMELPQFKNRIYKPLDCVDNTTVENFGDPFKYEINEDGQTIDNSPDDFEGHGTAVTSIIGAEDDDFYGLNQFAKIIPIRSLYRYQNVVTGDSHSSSRLENIITGIRHAVSANADVINMSLGSSYYQPDEIAQLHFEIQKAYDKGICIFGSTGNENTTMASHPASFEEVLAVSASDIKSKRWYLANHGDKYNDFVTAPGSGILALHTNGKWYQHHGTSLATPIVSGLASLIIGHFKSVNYYYSPSTIYNIIRDTCTESQEDDLGRGIVNAAKAIERVLNLTLPT